MRKGVGLLDTVRVTLGSVAVMSRGLGPWAPSVFSGESEEAGQSWVGGRLLGTRRGCPDHWRGFWAVELPMSLSATAGTRTWRGLGLDMSSPGAFFGRKQGPGFLPLLADGGLEPCRAVAKRWYLA